MDVPSVVPWSSEKELEQLKSWFYDPQPPSVPSEPPLDLRQRAIERVSRNTHLRIQNLTYNRSKHTKRAARPYLPR